MLRLLAILVIFNAVNYKLEDVSEKAALKEKAECLKKLYSDYIKYPDSMQIINDFFENFPNTFDEFLKLYGYQNNQEGLLYENQDDHVRRLFCNLDSCICLEEYLSKLVQLGIGGKWQADAVAEIQYKSQNLIIANPEITLKILQNFEEDQIIDYFFFFFHSIHPRWKAMPRELLYIKKKKPSIYNLIKIGYERAIKASGHQILK